MICRSFATAHPVSGLPVYTSCRVRSARVVFFLVWCIAITSSARAATDTPPTNTGSAVPVKSDVVHPDGSISMPERGTTSVAGSPDTTPPLPGAVGLAPARVDAAPSDPMLVAGSPAPRTLNSWSEAVQLLKARSLDIRIALLDVTKAEAQSRTALAAVLPSLNASTSYNHQLITRTMLSTTRDANNALVTRSVTTPTPDTLSASVTLSVPIVNAPAWYAIGSANLSEEVARLSVDDLKRRLALGMANAIVAVVTAERVAELNRIGLSNALTRQGLAAAKFRNGIATSLDLERANQDVISTRAGVIGGDESVRQAREALGLALGFSEAVGVRPELSLDGLLSDTRASCRATSALRERADLVAQERRRQLARRQIKSIDLQFLPTLNLSSSVGTTTPKSALVPPATWNIQAVLNWSIWDGGARYGARRSARALAEQADATYEAIERSETIAVQQARRQVSVAESAVAIARQARDAALQIDQMTQKLFRAGASTSLELVIAATALRQAEIALATREFDLVRAEVAAAMILANCPW